MMYFEFTLGRMTWENSGNCSPRAGAKGLRQPSPGVPVLVLVWLSCLSSLLNHHSRDWRGRNRLRFHWVPLSSRALFRTDYRLYGRNQIYGSVELKEKL